MIPVLRIGIAGLGTVGGGVLRLLQAHADLLAQRSGRRIVVAAVSARDRHRDRGVPLDGVRWYDDAVALAADPEIDVVVELIGGANGIAKAVCETAIGQGKSVVTANKALLAVHGPDLAARAEEARVALAFEAAVAGGIPAIKGLREGLAGNRIDGVFGILNGTCNYILTEMRTTGREFAEVLAEAQKLGYAEADPSFDVDGIDAAHKLAVLAALAFNARVEFDDLHIEGIRQISALDIAYAQELGYRIKLLGIARRTPEGLSLRVHPCMVAEASPIAHVEGVFNAVVAQGDFVGQVMMTGRGAGAGPTASAVVADLVDLARGLRVPTLGTPAARLDRATVAPMDHRRGAYYLRLMVVDRPGVIADVAAAMRDQQISVESLLQRGRSPGDAVPLVIITHETDEAAMTRLLSALGALDAVLEPPHVIRIEDL
ncbi:homoserine dehydrogenase [Mycobacterium sp. KBS0706]|uniref:homoserine dehydrogenase n=1 Tax=Mycobacterium sp. KBS0706 TaxID=2578109 RepID=UPI00110FC24E|nr:homoserine dehydrogenase [Mycobacterium sp. KBS0706]TSD84065.1 homoserine dehydrogenase [Mycobacterium sp. KBS0706]